MSRYFEVYDLLQERAAASAGVAREIILGLTWTLCSSEHGTGLAMSPALATGPETRRLPWPGTLAGRRLAELGGWLRSWNPFEAAVGMAATNAAINRADCLPQGAVALGAGNLAVFDHFLPLITGKKVVVVGRYPGLESYREAIDLAVLERQPGDGDLPDPAAEFLLPEADWVFLTASSLTNKTFPRLAELSHDAHLVLMGPTTPWLPELREFGVDFLAGVTVEDVDAARATVAEGGGVRLFDTAVRYCIADLGLGEMEQLKSEISGLAQQRGLLKEQMERWYSGTHRGSFPGRESLERVDRELALLDSRYKRLWDARFGKRPDREAA